jgi:hypothetical protein
MPLRTFTALAAATASFAAAPAALAQAPSGSSAGASSSVNVCLAGSGCTSINLHSGAPIDIVGRTGSIVRWSLDPSTEGGHVSLRVLRPIVRDHHKLNDGSSGKPDLVRRRHHTPPSDLVKS